MKIINNKAFIPIFDYRGGIVKRKKETIKELYINYDPVPKTIFQKIAKKVQMIFQVVFNKYVTVTYLDKNNYARITSYKRNPEIEYEISKIVIQAEYEEKFYRERLINPNFENCKLN